MTDEPIQVDPAPIDEPVPESPPPETTEQLVDGAPASDTKLTIGDAGGSEVFTTIAPPEAAETPVAAPEQAPVPDAVPPSDAVPVEAAPDTAPVDTPPVVVDEPPADPIITDPVLVDVPVDSVFDVPIELLDTAAVVALETMPDEDKTVLQTFISTDYWGEYEHFFCTIPNCQRDFLSEAAMVSHVATEHRADDADTPVGQRAVRDRFDNLIGYEEV